MDLSYDDIISLTSTADYVVVDTEGVTRMLGFSIAFKGLQEGFYLPFSHDEKDRNLTPDQKKRIFEVLNTRKALIFHNAVHDLRVLERGGFKYEGKFYDTMLMQHWVNEELRNYKLDNLSKIHGHAGKMMPEVMKFIIETEGWDAVPIDPMTEYSGGTGDAYITDEIFWDIVEQFRDEGFDGALWDIEQEFIRDVMGPMMDLGIKVDLEFCIREYLKGTAIMEECKKELGMNPSSNKDMNKLLIEELGLPVLKHTASCIKCKKRQPVASHTWTASFDKMAMEEYDLLLEAKDDHRARTILRYRGWQKATSSNYKPYMDLVDENAVLHPGYKLHGTRTGRLSCEKPNLQQIPKASDKEWNGLLDQAFIARDGFDLWKFDFSQLQFRMTCAYARQMDLIEIFNHRERDIFTEMAKDIAWKRQDVKTLVYLILFGGGANRAAVAFGVSVPKGKQLVEEFHARYPGIRKIANECMRAAKVQKYVSYWSGRRRHFFPGGAPTYRAFNAVIQGGEAEIMKRCMIRLQKEVCDENCRMVLQIHDAIAFEITKGMEDHYFPLIQAVMESTPQEFCDFVGVNVNFFVSPEPWKKDKELVAA